MDKNIAKFDKEKIYFKIYNIVGVGSLIALIIPFLFSHMLPEWFVNVMFLFWLILFISFVLIDLLLYLKLRKKTAEIFKSKYLFNRETLPENIETKFKDCIMQEVEFNEDGFMLNGLKTLYDDVKLEYSVYGDNIMFHIYVKGEETSPLLVFIVTKEMYFMIKKFNLNSELLDNEIDMLNLNERK